MGRMSERKPMRSVKRKWVKHYVCATLLGTEVSNCGIVAVTWKNNRYQSMFIRANFAHVHHLLEYSECLENHFGALFVFVLLWATLNFGAKLETKCWKFAVQFRAG